ncbi:hypothetical protein [Paracoccus marcusii]|uniref:Uncharacterized protein n=1 Tax=Paracoccus marcusii TaxID=59779 RepID=A0ABY7UPF9_9RHOB|nr:hypothetical protein [Paracoccus marcusii]WDA11823.1 hypothetical protein PRL19_11005 [Paracoccus marcusii]
MPPENSTEKASAEHRLLASIDLIDAAAACRLLRIETDDPEGAMQAMVRKDAIITLVQNGRTMVPQFQIDTERGRVFDVVLNLLKLKPCRMSNLRLAYWLTRAHVDLGGPPADRFGHDDATIVAAFRLYIEPEHQG